MSERDRASFWEIFNHLFACRCFDLSMPCKVQLQLASEPEGTMLDITEHQVWIFLNCSLAGHWLFMTLPDLLSVFF